jgi:hypothetical protein
MSSTEQLRLLIDTLDTADISNIASLFAYQGFSAELVLSHLHDVKMKKSIPDHTFKSDMKTLLVATIVMGNVNNNNIKKITENGKTSIEELMTKYEIKKGSLADQKKAVTLPRLAATFPIQISKFQMLTHEKNYNNELDSSILPKCFKVSIFPSLVPRSLRLELQHSLLVISNAHSTEQSLAIGKVKDISTVYKKQWEFTQIGFNSPTPKDKDRSDYMCTLEFNYSSMKKVFDNVYSTIKGIEPKVFPSLEAWKSGGINMN